MIFSVSLLSLLGFTFKYKPGTNKWDPEAYWGRLKLDPGLKTKEHDLSVQPITLSSNAKYQAPLLLETSKYFPVVHTPRTPVLKASSSQ
jgi:hypothetical protein